MASYSAGFSISKVEAISFAMSCWDCKPCLSSISFALIAEPRACGFVFIDGFAVTSKFNSISPYLSCETPLSLQIFINLANSFTDNGLFIHKNREQVYPKDQAQLRDLDRLLPRQSLGTTRADVLFQTLD